MGEKLLIISSGYGETNITTVDGTKRNLIKTYELEPHSFSEVAEKVFKRYEKEKYDKVIVDANGVGMALVDQLIVLFKEKGYSYDAKTGVVTNNKLDSNINWTIKVPSISLKEEF